MIRTISCLTVDDYQEKKIEPRRDTDLHGNGKRISVFICVNPWLKIALEFKKMSSKTASDDRLLKITYKPEDGELTVITTIARGE